MKPEDLDAWLYSGDYERVLSETANRPSAHGRTAIVGALALSGRVDEAETFAKIWLRSKEATVESRAATRFYLAVGHCHAGSLSRAWRCARPNSKALHSREPKARFFAYQAFALIRYFEGRLERSRRLSRRALDAAVEADFPYARMLVLDLLGHAAVLTGRVAAGLRMLQQAYTLAKNLGFDENAKTLQAAAVTCQLGYRCGDVTALRQKVAVLAVSDEVGFFSRRIALVQLAWNDAIEGRRTSAEALLAQAAQIALSTDDERAGVRMLVAEALMAALGESMQTAKQLLDDAAAISVGNLTLDSEIAFARALLLRERDPKLDGLAARTGMHRAHFAEWIVNRWAAPDKCSPLSAARTGDAFIETLASLPVPATVQGAQLLVDHQLLGLLPWYFGLEPAKRVYFLMDLLVVEDHGNTTAHDAPSASSKKLLLALANRPMEKAELVAAAWGVRGYVPHLHDATLHTAIARLRGTLGHAAHWIVTTEAGYRLAHGVTIFQYDASAQVGVRLAEVDSAESTDSAKSAKSQASLVPARLAVVKGSKQTRREKAIKYLRANGDVRVLDLARALRVSESSALRLLRALVGEKVALKVGKSRTTCYRMAHED